MYANYRAFCLCFHHEIDEFRFSGTEQILGDAPLIFPLRCASILNADSSDFARSIGVLKNARKLTSVLLMFPSQNRRISVFWHRTNFRRRAFDFSFAVRIDFQNAASSDFDCSIDRGAQKCTQVNERFPHVSLTKSTNFGFWAPNKF